MQAYVGTLQRTLSENAPRLQVRAGSGCTAGGQPKAAGFLRPAAAGLAVCWVQVPFWLWLGMKMGCPAQPSPPNPTLPRLTAPHPHPPAGGV